MRVVKHESVKPFVIKLGELQQLKGKLDEEAAKTELHICACGLSKHKPFCDGSHRLVQNEDKEEIFLYNKSGQRIKLNGQNAIEEIKNAPVEYE